METTWKPYGTSWKPHGISYKKSLEHKKNLMKIHWNIIKTSCETSTDIYKPHEHFLETSWNLMELRGNLM